MKQHMDLMEAKLTFKNKDWLMLILLVRSRYRFLFFFSLSQAFNFELVSFTLFTPESNNMMDMYVYKEGQTKAVQMV